MTRTYGGLSLDERRAHRRRSLLDATVGCVGEFGTAGTSIDSVCSRAGLTKRYFYEAFPGLEAAMVAALDELFTDIRERIAAALRSAPRAAQPRAERVVAILVETLTADPGRARLYVEAPALPATRALRDEAIADFTDVVLSDVLEFTGRRRPGIRRDIAVRILVAGITDLVASWLAGSTPADTRSLVRTIAATGLAVAAAL